MSLPLHIGWMCSCPDHLHTGIICKHTQAVQFEYDEPHIIQPYDRTTCKFCDSTSIIKKGKRCGKQQYHCKVCGKRFVQNLGFEGRRHTSKHITLAIKIVYGPYFLP